MNKIFVQLIKCFYPPAVVFFLHIMLGGYFRFYLIFPNFDIPMHFLGGMSIGITGVLLLRLAQKEGWMNIKKKIISLFLILCFVALSATLWEFLEWIGDFYLQTRMQEGLNDTMGDMFLGLIGGLISTVLLFVPKFQTKK